MENGNWTRDDWASIPLAMNSLAAALMARYPQSGVGQYVAGQYDIAKQNMQTMKEEEEARQAAKAANRNKNQMMPFKLLSATGIPGVKQVGDMGQVAMGGGGGGGGTAPNMLNAFKSMFGGSGGQSQAGPYASGYKFPTPTAYDEEYGSDFYGKLYGF